MHTYTYTLQREIYIQRERRWLLRSLSSFLKLVCRAGVALAKPNIIEYGAPGTHSPHMSFDQEHAPMIDGLGNILFENIRK